MLTHGGVFGGNSRAITPTALTRFQDEVLVKELRQEGAQPQLEGLLPLGVRDHPSHQIGLLEDSKNVDCSKALKKDLPFHFNLKAGREEVVAAGLPLQGAAAVGAEVRRGVVLDQGEQIRVAHI